MTIDINEWRRLAQTATPGPWVATTVVTSVGVCHKVGPFPGKTAEHPPRHACLYVDYESAGNPADREIYTNAAFIAAVNPAAISELLDRLEAAEGELETERMRLAVCSVAALGYFEGCAKEYASASLDDVLNLRKRLEAAERERDDVAQQLAQAEIGKRKLDAECDALRAKIEQMERQEPAGTLHDDGYFVWRRGCRPYESNYVGWMMKLYALPGAKGE